MGGLGQDLRLAFRLLAKDRRFTIAAVVALGLGIGVNTTVFATINAAMLRDVPFDEPEQLVGLRTRDARGSDAGVSYPDFVDWRQATSAFAGLAAETSGVMNLSEEGRSPERFRGAYVSANTFRLLRTAPVLGRDFLPEDDRPGTPAVLLVSHGVWQSRYGGDPAVIGRAVRVNDVPATVIGIMPAGFRYPFINEIWLPLSQLPGIATARRDARSLGVVGRMREDVRLPQARADLDTIAARLRNDYPDTNKETFVDAALLKDRRPSIPSAMLIAMVGAVSFVLLIAYANLANLLLARSVHRSREMAIRVSIGATRWRIVRQLLIECALLAVLGGLVGFAFSVYGVREIAVAFEPIEAGARPGTMTPYWLDVTPNGFVFAFVGALCIVSALAFGLVPAWHIVKTNTHDALKEGGRTGAATIRARRWTGALLVAELALTLILLTGAGLLWRSFAVQYRRDFVLDTSNVVTMRLTLPPQKYATPDARRRFLEQLDDRLGSLPVFSSVTMASHVPLEFGAPVRELSIDGVRREAGEKPPLITYLLTGTRYFETIKLPVVRGRGFTPADARAGQEAAIVDQRFAERFFSNDDPIGHRIQLRAANPTAQPGPWLTIVGVAQAVIQFGPQEFSRPLVYAPLRADPSPDGRAAVIVKGSASANAATDSGLTAITASLREEVRALDPNLPLYAIETMDTTIARSRYPVRLVGTWFGVLAVIALVLASVGVFALTAHGVAQRTQEIGVRMALGAQAREVVWLFLRRTIVHLAIGLAIGLGGALTVGRLLQTLLGQVSPRDPITIAIVTALLVIVAGAATMFPARRAARVDPMVALRTE